MNKREVNEQLFKVIVKTLVDCKNRLHLGRLVQLTAQRTGLSQEYTHRFIVIMYRKGLLEAVYAGKRVPQFMELALTKAGCDQYRELRDGLVHEGEQPRVLVPEHTCMTCGCEVTESNGYIIQADNGVEVECYKCEAFEQEAEL